MSRLISISLFVFLVAVLFCGATACTRKNGHPEKVVNVAVWAAYLSGDSIEAFQKKTGIRVIISNYASNEELLAKLQAGAKGYDVIFPSDYMVSVMTKLGLLEELDHGRIPAFADLTPDRMRQKFDPQNRFSLPYGWGTTGIAVRTDKYKRKIEGWKDLLTREDLKGKFTLLDDVREALGTATLSLGYGLNTTKAEELNQAAELLKSAKERAQAFVSDSKPLLTSGQVAVAQSYSTDALQANRETGGKVEYIIPKEGCTLWIDNLSIVKGTQHLEEAYAFVAYMLSEENNMRVAQDIRIAPTNRKAIAKLPKEYGPGSAILPTAEKLKNCRMIEDIGDDIKIWDEAWTRVKAS